MGKTVTKILLEKNSEEFYWKNSNKNFGTKVGVGGEPFYWEKQEGILLEKNSNKNLGKKVGVGGLVIGENRKEVYWKKKQ